MKVTDLFHKKQKQLFERYHSFLHDLHQKCIFPTSKAFISYLNPLQQGHNKGCKNIYIE
jgi:hypothetical protein